MGQEKQTRCKKKREKKDQDALKTKKKTLSDIPNRQLLGESCFSSLWSVFLLLFSFVYPPINNSNRGNCSTYLLGAFVALFPSNELPLWFLRVSIRSRG